MNKDKCSSVLQADTQGEHNQKCILTRMVTWGQQWPRRWRGRCPAGLQWGDVVCLALASSQLQQETNKEKKGGVLILTCLLCFFFVYQTKEDAVSSLECEEWWFCILLNHSLGPGRPELQLRGNACSVICMRRCTLKWTVLNKCLKRRVITFYVDLSAVPMGVD